MVRIITHIDTDLYVWLMGRAEAERRPVRDQAAMMLEAKLREERALESNGTPFGGMAQPTAREAVRT